MSAVNKIIQFSCYPYIIAPIWVVIIIITIISCGTKKNVVSQSLFSREERLVLIDNILKDLYEGDKKKSLRKIYIDPSTKDITSQFSDSFCEMCSNTYARQEELIIAVDDSTYITQEFIIKRLPIQVDRRSLLYDFWEFSLVYEGKMDGTYCILSKMSNYESLTYNAYLISDKKEIKRIDILIVYN